MSKYVRVKDKLDTRDHKYKVTSAVDYPRLVDLRKYCSQVEDQKQEGSCTGNAIVGAMEFLENIQQEEPVRLSRAFVYANELLLEGTFGKDAGANLRDGIKVIAKYGVCAERLWPYTGTTDYKRKPDDPAYADALKRRALRYQSVDQTEDALLHCLVFNRPIVFGIMVYSSFESDEVAKTGIVPMPKPTEKCLGGHAVLIVGYDRDKRMFLVRNSWGKSWGIKGYCWMPFDFVLNPELADSFWTISKMM
jgi:C1A family cysteine protease